MLERSAKLPPTPRASGRSSWARPLLHSVVQDGHDYTTGNPGVTAGSSYQSKTGHLCTGSERTLPRSSCPIVAVVDRTAQIRMGLATNLWRLSTRPASPRRPALNTMLPALPIALSTASFHHNASGNRPPTALILLALCHPSFSVDAFTSRRFAVDRSLRESPVNQGPTNLQRQQAETLKC